MVVDVAEVVREAAMGAAREVAMVVEAKAVVAREEATAAAVRVVVAGTEARQRVLRVGRMVAALVVAMVGWWWR